MEYGHQIRLSVIVPTYKRPSHILEVCLLSLAAQDLPKGTLEIIVVDDENSPATQFLVQRFKDTIPNLRYLASSSHRGPGFARNLGAKEASADIISFIDDDCVVARDWVQNILNSFARFKEADGVLGNIKALNYHNLIARAYAVNFEFAVRSQMRKNPNRTTMICGGNISFRKEFFLKVGGFGEYYRSDETALVCKSRAAGGKIFYDSSVLVLHSFPERMHILFKKNFWDGFYIYKTHKSFLGASPVSFFNRSDRPLGLYCLKEYSYTGIVLFLVLFVRKLLLSLGALCASFGE